MAFTPPASAGGISNIVEDTSPQLGGNLDQNGFTITGLIVGTDVLASVVGDSTPQLGGDLDMNGNQITSPDGTDLIDIPNGSLDLQTASTSRMDITDSGVRLGAANARVTTVLDEDAMGTDSATALATQQSIKAYVDSQAGGAVKTMSSHEFTTITPYTTTASNSGTVTAGSSPGPYLKLFTSINSSNSAAALAVTSGASSLDSDFWDLDPEINYIVDHSVATGSWRGSYCLDSSSLATGGPSTSGAYTTKHAGFIITVNSGTVIIYASNATGSVQTKTDVTGSYTITNNLRFRTVVTSGTDVKFYINGTLVATHTTNLPSGAQTTSPYLCGMLLTNTSAQNVTASVSMFSIGFNAES